MAAQKNIRLAENAYRMHNKPTNISSMFANEEWGFGRRSFGV